MTLSDLARVLRHSDFKHRLRHVDCDRRTIHLDSSFHRGLWTQGDFGTSMPFKSREESIPSSSTPAAVGATASARVPTGSRGASGSTWAPPASASGWRGRWARCRCWPGRWPAVSSHTPRSGVGRAGTAEHVERIVRGWRRVDRIAEAKQSTQRHRSRALHVYQDEDGAGDRGRADEGAQRGTRGDVPTNEKRFRTNAQYGCRGTD